MTFKTQVKCWRTFESSFLNFTKYGIYLVLPPNASIHCASFRPKCALKRKINDYFFNNI